MLSTLNKSYKRILPQLGKRTNMSSTFCGLPPDYITYKPQKTVCHYNQHLKIVPQTTVGEKPVTFADVQKRMKAKLENNFRPTSN